MQFLRPFALWSAATIALGIGTIGAMSSTDAAAGTVVVTSPFADGSALVVIASAGGHLLRAGRWQWVAVGTDDRADFPGRLRQAGAWLVLPAEFSVFCKADRPA